MDETVRLPYHFSMVDPFRTDMLRRVAAAALDRPDVAADELGTVRVEVSDHRVDNMTTASLHLVSGTVADGATWRAFAKVLHPASSSPLMQYIPPDHHESVLRNLDWLDEPAVYRSALGRDLPDGIRLPRLFAIDPHPDTIALWLEQVDDRSAWELDDYRDAARALGAMAGRWPERRVVDELGLDRRDLGDLFFGKLASFDLPILADDSHWADAGVAAATDADFRRDLQALIDRTPGRIAAAERLPHALSHGDATPHNLLLTDDGLVAIDWSYGSSGPLGADLAQLFAGRFDTGDAAPGDAPQIAEVLLESYVDGLADEGIRADRAEVLAGWATHLAVRSVISSTVVEHRPDLDDAARVGLIEQRVAAARIGIDLERALDVMH